MSHIEIIAQNNCHSYIIINDPLTLLGSFMSNKNLCRQLFKNRTIEISILFESFSLIQNYSLRTIFNFTLVISNFVVIKMKRLRYMEILSQKDIKMIGTTCFLNRKLMKSTLIHFT